MNLKARGFVGLPKRTLGIGPLKAERMADPEMGGIKEAGVVTLSIKRPGGGGATETPGRKGTGNGGGDSSGRVGEA
jgi:hypothetical protein